MNWNNEINIVASWLENLSAMEKSRLRRCGSLIDVKSEPAFGRLIMLTLETRINHHGALALAAGVLPHVASWSNVNRFGQAAALGGLSQNRLSRLLACDNYDDELYTALRRSVAVIKSAPRDNLIAVCLWWNEQTRAAIASDYYSVTLSGAK